MGPALVDDDLVKPTPKMFRILAASKTAKSAHESRLKCVVRIHVRPKHPHSKTGAHILIALNQAGKRVDVAGEDGCNQFCIRQCCHKRMTT
jgi:hypothetical protein